MIKLVKVILWSTIMLMHLHSYGQEQHKLFDSLMFSNASATSNVQIKGHSHNDYEQHIPFYTAYYAGMESIEADVFLRNGVLYVAHNKNEIKKDRTLSSLYLDPIIRMMKTHDGHIFQDKNKKMQLMIDIKEDYVHALDNLIKLISTHGEVFDTSKNPNAVKIVISGDRPVPADFKKYPKWLFFDGLVDQTYTADQWKRVAMISADLKDYTNWNGKGTPIPEDKAKIKAAIAIAEQQQLPFRFWDNHDSPNTWQELNKLGVYWINTDQPEALSRFIDRMPYEQFRLTEPQQVYTPSYQVDDTDTDIRKVILLIGDGMGLAQVKAAMAVNRGLLHMSTMRKIGISRTEAANSDNTDSAAGGSALATGKKTNNRSIAVDTLGKPMTSLADTLQKMGWGTAILSTGDLTDATPAVFYAHVAERDSSKVIAAQALDAPFSILAGGTPGWFKGEAAQQYRTSMQQKGIAYGQTPQLQSAAKKQILFLDATYTKPIKDGRTQVLSQLLRESLTVLDKQHDRFFIMAEGAQIDYGGHANDLPYVISETLDFDLAVGEALRYADQDGHTLVIVTADHETGGLTLLDSDEKNGYVRGNFSSNDHTSVPVPVFIYGPKSDKLTGYYPNTELFHRILKIVK
ncbi:alkaline phosphatase [Sphingobacterium sp. SRCM116780]|uniref:alkaline phosphatase n=1 Tax=Sphingobacterium sp. SRCM116780 TaxID=2907623 RepID=UPI001F30C202|nr:alkaline phosphatase [Sphingobacterium sp. SRCM116780]UIR55213.1 alkaline phosphatase [Sphingobacterium sp. SRCM116780]